MSSGGGLRQSVISSRSSGVKSIPKTVNIFGQLFVIFVGQNAQRSVSLFKRTTVDFGAARPAVNFGAGKPTVNLG